MAIANCALRPPEGLSQRIKPSGKIVRYVKFCEETKKMKQPVDAAIKDLLNEKLRQLENHLKADVISYTGPFLDGTESSFKQVIKDLSKDSNKKEPLRTLITSYYQLLSDFLKENNSIFVHTRNFI
jgi:hypothetical protein